MSVERESVVVRYVTLYYVALELIVYTLFNLLLLCVVLPVGVAYWSFTVGSSDRGFNFLFPLDKILLRCDLALEFVRFY